MEPIYSLDIENSIRPSKGMMKQLLERVGGVAAALTLELDEKLIYDPENEGRGHYPLGKCDRLEWIAVQWLRWAVPKGILWENALSDEITPIVNSIALSRCFLAKDEAELRVPASVYREADGFEWRHNSWESCIDYLFSLCGTDRTKIGGNSITVGVHNLSYEGSYIIPFLVSNGWESSEVVKDKSYKCITDGRTIYRLTLRRIIRGRICRVDMCCTLSMTGLDLATAAGPRGYGLPTQKKSGDLDYTIYREMGDEFTEEEEGYIAGDVDATVELLRYLRFIGVHSLTAASHAIKTLCQHAAYELETGDECPEDVAGAAAYDERMTAWVKTNGMDGIRAYKRVIGRIVPKISGDEDTLIRLAYDGGAVLVNDTYKGKWIETRSFDVNSEFAAAMLGEMPGKPFMRDGNSRGKGLYINFFCVSGLKVKPGMPPMLPGFGSLIEGGSGRLTEWHCSTEPEWCDASDFPRDKEARGRGYWGLCAEDFERMWECYDVEGYVPLFQIRFKPAFNPCKSFVRSAYAQKAAATAAGDYGRRAYAKLLLTSAYGKFGTRANREEWEAGAEAGVLSMTKTGAASDASVNVAIASFITARAREIQYQGIKSVEWKNVAYSDTDSMKIAGDIDIESKIEVSPTKLGAWKDEGGGLSIFIGPKQYMVINGDKVSASAAGYDKDYMCTIRDEYASQKYAWAKSAVRAPGGRVILPAVHRRTIFEE